MQIQSLVDVTAICASGSFRQAARELGISQATLSHRIDRLEQQLGARLFDRGRGRTRPTDLGQYVAAQASELVADAREIAENIYRVAQGRGGQVRIGFAPAPAHRFLAEVVHEVRSAIGGLAVSSYIGTTQQLANLLDSGDIDLAVCPADRGILGDRFHVSLLQEAPVFIAAAPNHPVLNARETFFQQPMALPVLEPGYRTVAKDLFGVDFEMIEDVVYISDYSILIDLVSQGDFVTAGPRFAFERDVEAGTIAVAALDRRVNYQIHIVRRQRPISLPILEQVESRIRGIIH